MRLPPLIRLLRPFTLLPPLLGMLSGAASALGAGRAEVDALRGTLFVVCGALMAATLNGASNVLNQVHDLELDRVNKPERPLPAGELTVAAARRFARALYLVSIVLAFLILPAGFPEVGVIVLLTAGLTWAYSSPPLRLRSSWWAGPLVIAIPRGGLLKVAGWGTLAPVFSDREPWILGALFFLLILGAAPTKDFEDMEGDRRFGASSLPLRFGPRRAALLMAPFYVMPWIALAVLPRIDLVIDEHNRIDPHRIDLVGRPLLSLAIGPATIAAVLLGGHGLVTAVLLVVRAGRPGGLGRGAWRNLYLLMMEAQVALAVLYLAFPAR